MLSRDDAGKSNADSGTQVRHDVTGASNSSSSTAHEACDAPVCGDGQATTCETAREDCDGDDLRNLACTDYGFAGGTLACSNKCAIDTSQCEPCGNDARIDQCTAVETLPGHSYGLGIAWRDDTLLVATAISDQNALSERDAHPLRLLAFDADLNAIGKPRELAAKNAWITGLAAVSDGFLIAYLDGWPGRGVPLRTQHLDASGAPDADPIDHAGVESGYLVARPDGGPLLVANPATTAPTASPDGGTPPSGNPARTDYGVYAILLDERGEEVWAAATEQNSTGELTAGAYTGSGFVFPVHSVGTAGVWHIDLDGNLSLSPWSIPATTQDTAVSYAQVAWDGSSASVVWSDTGADGMNCPKPPPSTDRDAATAICTIAPSELRWARLDQNAGLIEGPGTVIGVTRAPARWIANNEQRVLVTGQPTAEVGVTSGLRAQHYDALLNPSDDPITLVSEPDGPALDTDVTPQNVYRFEATFGPDRSVFVAWTRVSEEPRHGLLGIAKIAR